MKIIVEFSLGNKFNKKNEFLHRLQAPRHSISTAIHLSRRVGKRWTCRRSKSLWLFIVIVSLLVDGVHSISKFYVKKKNGEKKNMKIMRFCVGRMKWSRTFSYFVAFLHFQFDRWNEKKRLENVEIKYDASVYLWLGRFPYSSVVILTFRKLHRFVSFHASIMIFVIQFFFIRK